MTGTTEGGKKTAQGDRGNSEKASPAAIEHYIKGIKFPANKNDLIDQAKESDAPDDVMNVMQKFEEKDYHSSIDVSREVGKIK
jgi:hypothetical protein